jgi:hypothetical protein
MWLLLLAAFGLLVPNGLFVRWLVRDFSGIDAVLQNELALAFMIDAALATGLLAWLFARRPLGPVRWPWFVLLSLLGGLGFSIPFWVWLNRRLAGGAGGDPGPAPPADAVE